MNENKGSIFLQMYFRDAEAFCYQGLHPRSEVRWTRQRSPQYMIAASISISLGNNSSWGGQNQTREIRI